MSFITMFGRIPIPDRVQRLLLGTCLMVLTVMGMLESTDWKHWVAIVLQTELLLTGLFGWCPVYWACRVGQIPDNREHQ